MVLETAKIFSDISINRIENIMKQLIDNGEDKTLGILLNVCTVNQIPLDPEKFVETIKVVYVPEDFYMLFRFQNERAISPLLTMTMAEDISLERRANIGRLATELTIRYKQDRQTIKKVLLKLRDKIYLEEIGFIVEAALYILDDPELDKSDIRWLIDLDILKELPEDKPPTLIGGDYTIRRPVEKLGRNEPCHCGSGKKYKHCCYNNDQDLIHDASQYKGITMTEVQASPNIVDDTYIINKMQPYELKKLNPVKLNNDQLIIAYQRLDYFGFREIAYDMLLELKNRPGQKELALEHMEDLLYSTLVAKEALLARKIREQLPDDVIDESEEIQLRLDSIENSDRYTELESYCHKALLMEGKEHIPNNPLFNLCYHFQDIYPALSIIFGRSAVLSYPDRFLDNDFLLDNIYDIRKNLDLKNSIDPILDYYDWFVDNEEHEQLLEDKSEEIKKLMQETEESKKKVNKKIHYLRQKETELNKLLKKNLQKIENQSEVGPETKGKTDTSQGNEETVTNLRRQVKNLKAEIKIQQEERRLLRSQLQKKKQKSDIFEEKKIKPVPQPEAEDTIRYEKLPKQILVPEYTEQFRRSCSALSSQLTAKALKVVTGFAVHDKTTWKHTKKIELISGFYRIRINLQYRLIIQWEPNACLKILDLIHRSKLETWIREHNQK
jgi:plasmid maintenance system killer protein